VVFKKWVEYAQRKGENPLKFDLVLVKQFLSKYKVTTRGSYAWKLRKIFNLNGEHTNFKVRCVDNELPECLTLNEVNKIFANTESLKWRALFQLTYEGALRQHEVLGMRMKHVKFDKYGAEVFIPSTKSQALWLRVINSVGILQTWVEQHPNKNDRDAPLFLGRKKEQSLTDTANYYMVREVAKRAGIQKHVTPHILRHSRLWWLKKYGAKLGISDSVICKLYGRWSRKNAHRMLDRYGRIDPEDANEVVLKAFGKLESEDFVEKLAKPKVCSRCKTENDVLSKYCRLCGMVLDEKTAQSLTRDAEDFRKIVEVLRDPEKMRRFEELLKE